MWLPIKTFFKQLYRSFMSVEIFSRAAQVGFYFIFAIFPLLLFLISLIGIYLDGAAEIRAQLFFYLRHVMPNSAFNLVQNIIKETSENSTTGKLTIGLLVALWSASTGIDTLRIALNEVYGFVETRAIWFTRPLAILLTFVFSALVTLALGGVFYGWEFTLFLFNSAGFTPPSETELVYFEWITTLLILLVIFEIIYNVLPNRKPFKWFWITPGAIVGIVAWLLISTGLKIYLTYFNTYDRTYGSIGAVIILMLWLYLTALTIIIGGMINAAMEVTLAAMNKNKQGEENKEEYVPNAT
ncbi:MAG: YihY/virulence factor BrkB family protein [Pyrinomonadaceae bacterium]